MHTEIKMPKEIVTMDQYYEWVKSFNTDKTELDVKMKRRTNFRPCAFCYEKDGVVEYSIDDGVATGKCKISNFNKVFKFEIISY